MDYKIATLKCMTGWTSAKLELSPEETEANQPQKVIDKGEKLMRLMPRIGGFHSSKQQLLVIWLLSFAANLFAKNLQKFLVIAWVHDRI